MLSAPDGASADDAIARVAADVARAEQRAERFAELQSATAALRVRTVSRERDIAVEVDSSGRLVGLRIHDVALSRGGSRLADEIVALIGSACRSLQEELREAAVRVLGEDEPLLHAFPAPSGVAGAARAATGEDLS
jgi:hypothetical protein